MSDQLSFGLIVLDPEEHRIQAMQSTRKCLSCERQFASAGPGNRICVSCKNRDAWSGPTAFSVVSSAAF